MATNNQLKMKDIITVRMIEIVATSLLVGWVGSRRKIGFWWSFILSLILTPVGGIILTLGSKKKDKC